MLNKWSLKTNIKKEKVYNILDYISHLIDFISI